MNNKMIDSQCSVVFSASHGAAAPRKRYKAFTLIELLVVVAIIGILAAILFPVFSQARERARRTSCLSNLKQIGLACMQYSQDYDEKIIPSYRYQYGIGDRRDYWYSIIDPYAKSSQILLCPSANGYAGSAGPSYMMFAVGYGGTKAIPTSSVLDYYHESVTTHVYVNVSLAQAARPSESVLMFENTYCDANFCNENQVLGGSDYFDPALLNANYKGRHQEGHNFLYIDGHAKWKKMTSFHGRDMVLNEGPEPGWVNW